MAPLVTPMDSVADAPQQMSMMSGARPADNHSDSIFSFHLNDNSTGCNPGVGIDDFMEKQNGAKGNQPFQEVMRKQPTTGYILKEGVHTMADGETFGNKGGKPSVNDVLGPKDGLLIKQTLKGCCCDLRNEFSIHDFLNDFDEFDGKEGPELMFLKEKDGSCLLRCLSDSAPGFRPTAFYTWCGAFSKADDKDRPAPFTSDSFFLHHHKGCTNGVYCKIRGKDGDCTIPCCCLLPYLITEDGNGTKLGSTHYVCDGCLFVPKYDVRGPEGEAWYRIRPDVCCGGCCVKCTCAGGCTKGRCFAIPYYIREPTAPYDYIEGAKSTEDPKGKIPNRAEITNLWSGHKELCNRQNYALRFPGSATPQQKATLMGSVILIEVAEHEQD